MGQYFQFVNVDRKETVHPPGGMKAIERLTSPVTMALLGYLLLDGPNDGTAFLRDADPDDPNLTEAIAELKERERQCEAERDTTSPYRNDDGSWNEHDVASIAASYAHIADTHDYAGRWAGDDVRMVGDYAESGYYRMPQKGEVTAEYRTGETVTYVARYPSPVRVDGDWTERRDTRLDGDPIHGDIVRIPTEVARESDHDDHYAYFRSFEPNDWTDITEGALEEFTDFVGEDWVESPRESILCPDMMLSMGGGE